MQIPRRTEEAGPEFVTAALRQGGVIGTGTHVEEVEHDTIGEGVGIVGQLARLQLRYGGPALGAPGTVILKLPSQYPENRAVADHFGFYEREGRFYQHIAGKLPVRVPRCYWNHIDPDSASFGLMLEDLGSRTSLSQLVGCDPTRAAAALAVLGRLHGSWWAAPELDALDWMPRLSDPINLAAGEQYRQAWPLFVERLEACLPSGAIELGRRVQAVFEDLIVQGMREAPVTVCHGDFRLDNLLFSDGSDDPFETVALLDWQISYRGPAVSDVAYFLCQSLDPGTRCREEKALLRGWYQALAEEVMGDPDAEITSYPFSVAWDQYRRSVLGTTVYPVTAAGAMDPANERGRELVETMAVRSFTAAIELDSEEFLPR